MLQHVREDIRISMHSHAAYIHVALPIPLAMIGGLLRLHVCCSNLQYTDSVNGYADFPMLQK